MPFGMFCNLMVELWLVITGKNSNELFVINKETFDGDMILNWISNHRCECQLILQVNRGWVSRVPCRISEACGGVDATVGQVCRVSRKGWGDTLCGVKFTMSFDDVEAWKGKRCSWKIMSREVKKRLCLDVVQPVIFSVEWASYEYCRDNSWGGICPRCLLMSKQSRDIQRSSSDHMMEVCWRVIQITFIVEDINSNQFIK